MSCQCYASTMPFFSRPQHSTAVSRWPCCAVALRRTAWSEHGMCMGMASVNQTRPHCVNQVRKTHSKSLATRHRWGMTWARHGNGMLSCGLEENGVVGAWHWHDMASVNQTRPHCVNQVGKTHSKSLAARHGRGMAWARHGNGVLCVNRPLEGQTSSCYKGKPQPVLVNSHYKLNYDKSTTTDRTVTDNRPGRVTLHRTIREAS
jgi:hypothetical protein